MRADIVVVSGTPADRRADSVRRRPQPYPAAHGAPSLAAPQGLHVALGRAKAARRYRVWSGALADGNYLRCRQSGGGACLPDEVGGPNTDGDGSPNGDLKRDAVGALGAAPGPYGTIAVVPNSTQPEPTAGFGVDRRSLAEIAQRQFGAWALTGNPADHDRTARSNDPSDLALGVGNRSSHRAPIFASLRSSVTTGSFRPAASPMIAAMASEVRGVCWRVMPPPVPCAAPGRGGSIPAPRGL